MAESNALSLVGTAVAQAQELATQIQLVSGNILTQDDALILGTMFQAGMFKDMNSLFNAVVKATFGKRIGIDAMTAVTSTYVIDGKLGMEAKAMRNTLVMAGYDINDVTPDGKENAECVLEWVYKGKVLGKSTFSLEDAVARKYVDPTCVKVEGFPHNHNDREISFYNRWKKPTPGYDKKTGCECKDNWRSMLQEMLYARATSKGNTRFGNKAFKQEVYEVSELIESPFREDTTPVEVARANIEKATTVEELQAITAELQPEELQQVLEHISAKTKEILHGSARRSDKSVKADTDTVSPEK